MNVWVGLEMSGHRGVNSIIFVSLCLSCVWPFMKITIIIVLFITPSPHPPEYYGDALAHHEQHLESPNLYDKFVAHTNIGLIYAGCGQPSEVLLSTDYCSILFSIH